MKYVHNFESQGMVCRIFFMDNKKDGLPEYFHSQQFMSARLSWRACFARPAMCCHNSIHEARLGVNEVDTLTGEEGWRLEEE
jgi:hypothetical protein